MSDIFHNVPPDSIVDDWLYGIAFLAVLLDRSVAGLRWSLSQSSSDSPQDYVLFLCQTRKRIGRRSYWVGSDLKRLIRGDFLDVAGGGK